MRTGPLDHKNESDKNCHQTINQYPGYHDLGYFYLKKNLLHCFTKKRLLYMAAMLHTETNKCINHLAYYHQQVKI